jgi:hypothetical protein
METTEPAELRPHDEQPDWSTLAARAIDDVARMAQAEIHLAEASFRASLKESVNDAFAMLAVGCFLAAAGVCLLAALILLLHQWFAWWLAFALTGCASATIGVAVILVSRASRRKKSFSESA